MNFIKLCVLFCKFAEEQIDESLEEKKPEEKKALNTLQDAADRAMKNGWTLVEKVTKPINAKTVRDAVRSVVINVFGGIENIDVATDILSAQLKLETGFKSVHNNNVGNLMAHYSTNKFWKGKVFSLLAGEVNEDNEEYFLNSLFRSYDSLNDGIADWALLLQTKFPKAVAKALQGDTVGFVTELKSGGYFTASLEKYLEGVQGVMGQFEKPKIDNPFLIT